MLKKDLRTIANAVIMVPPIDFAFNIETSKDNEFQTQLKIPDEQIKLKAFNEFNNAVEVLRSIGIHVTVMDYQQSEIVTPDAVFPNNWFLTTTHGELYLFPMANINRRQEIRPNILMKKLDQERFEILELHTRDDLMSPTAFLEGTGAMVIDHENSAVYSALSARCNKHLLQLYAKSLSLNKVIYFDTKMSSGAPVYHTNVMMAIGDKFAVICDEVIDDDVRSEVLASLAKTKDLVCITEHQMTQFCGNILQLANENDEKFILLSSCAFEAFTDSQLSKLERYGKLIPINVETIETIGGGSIRCMLAENYLPYR